MDIQLDIGTETVLDETIENDEGAADADFALTVSLGSGFRLEVNHEAGGEHARAVVYGPDGRTYQNTSLRLIWPSPVGHGHSVRVSD